MPRTILEPYFAYINHLKVRYQMGEFIGPPNHEFASIPQGCPFSMALVALVTRIWVSVMEENNVDPRCLADALMCAEGSGHRTRAIPGMNLSRQFFVDMGARVSTAKCFVFSTCPNTRAFLKVYTWGDESIHMPVANSFRDLGSHLNRTSHAKGST